jgi:hypothetical protein
MVVSFATGWVALFLVDFRARVLRDGAASPGRPDQVVNGAKQQAHNAGSARVGRSGEIAFGFD